MGRKINPIGFRLAVRRDWSSRWYAKGRDYAAMVIKDAEARNYIEKKYPQASISLIEIERTISSVRVIVHSARPGMVIGKKGEGIDGLRVDLRRLFGKTEVAVDIREVSQPDINAKLIALNIAAQLERRIMFRRAMRRAMASAMRLGVEGIKIMCAGRLNGIEIARTEWYREGRVPLHTLKNDVDYGVAQAQTSMGVVGIKVWVSRGEINVRGKRSKYSLNVKGGADEPAAPAIKDSPAAAAVAGKPTAVAPTTVAESEKSAVATPVTAPESEKSTAPAPAPAAKEDNATAG